MSCCQDCNVSDEAKVVGQHSIRYIGEQPLLLLQVQTFSCSTLGSYPRCTRLQQLWLAGLLWHKAVDMHEAELQVKCEAATGLRSAAGAGCVSSISMTLRHLDVP